MRKPILQKRILWVLGVVLVISMGAWLFSASVLPPVNLLQRATKIADVQDILSYDWLSSQELLVKTSTNRSKPNAQGHCRLPIGIRCVPLIPL